LQDRLFVQELKIEFFSGVVGIGTTAHGTSLQIPLHCDRISGMIRRSVEEISSREHPIL
jgi:hypothetical protein